MSDIKFVPFPKIGRLSRNCTITEKIDGTNGSIFIGLGLCSVVGKKADNSPDPCLNDATQEDQRCVLHSDTSTKAEYTFLVGSRTRWIDPKTDNAGFAKWAYAHKDELLKLGPGHHFGEWWGIGIQRNYGLQEKRFNLFNTNRWGDPASRPSCVGVVPVIYQGIFTGDAVQNSIEQLEVKGSYAAPGFMKPEGIVVYHHATKQLFKKTLEKDDQPKGQKEE